MADFVSTHALLGDDFFVPVRPAPVPKMVIRYRNQGAAKALGLDSLSDEAWCQHFGMFKPFDGSFDTPLALAYHGHQFGHYNPDIGDGRGFLFAQLIEPDTGRLLDFGTKGTGQTPFSRNGDGCLTLKGAVREVLATEFLSALGVPTSQSFSVIETGRALERHDEPSPTRSAVLVRLSHSHIRIGSFQRHLYLKNPEANERLARYVVEHYYPTRDHRAPFETLIVTLLCDLTQKVAAMTGGWMAAGFVHGVLNTDNFNLTGESFDYGPWRFLPHLDPQFTAAYFDHQGRYAYGRQPDAALWALCRFADCFAPQIGKEALEEALSPFYAHLEEAMISFLLRRLGLTGLVTDKSTGKALMHALLEGARKTACPFDEMFFDLYGGVMPDKPLYHADAFAPYFASLSSAHAQPHLGRDHVYFEKDAGQDIAKSASLVIDEVERVWEPIARDDDWQAFEDKLSAIRTYGEALARFDSQD